MVALTDTLTQAVANPHIGVFHEGSEPFYAHASLPCLGEGGDEGGAGRGAVPARPQAGEGSVRVAFGGERAARLPQSEDAGPLHRHAGAE